MASSGKFGRFTPNSAGISEVFRSPAMKSFVDGATQRVASQANAAEAANRAALPTKWRRIIERYDTGPAAYTGKTDVLDHVAVGMVWTSGLAGCIDQNQNQTLDGFK